MWSGMPLSLEEAEALYDVDHVKYVTTLSMDLRALGSVHAVEPSEDQ